MSHPSSFLPSSQGFFTVTESELFFFFLKPLFLPWKVGLWLLSCRGRAEEPEPLSLLQQGSCTAQPSLGAGVGLHGLCAPGAFLRVPQGGLRWGLTVPGKSSAHLKCQQVFRAGRLFLGEAVILPPLVPGTSKVCILASCLYLFPYLLLVYCSACKFFGR